MVATNSRLPEIGVAVLSVLAIFASIAGASAQSWQAEWDRTVAAAKKEGSLSLAGPSTAISRRVIEQFQTAYPDIRLRYTALHGEFWQRLESERSANVFAWDVFIGGAAVPTYNAAKKGLLLPIRPAVIRPDVYEDKHWMNGFDSAFGDNEKKFAFMFTADRLDVISINRTKVPESQLNSPQQLLDPRWKGQIVMLDPRQQGVGTMAIGSIRKDVGDDAARKIMTEQEPVLTTDRRQAAEFVIRGRYPIGIGVVSFHYVPFLEQGLGKDIGYLKADNPAISSSNAVVHLIANPPNPNAAKVFLDWLLSRETQEAWAKLNGTNSLRTDVASGGPDLAVNAQQFRKLPHVNTEDGVKFFFDETGDFVHKILK